MRFFFRSRQFRIIVCVFAVIVSLSIVFALIGERIAPQADIAGAIAAPFRSAARSVSNAFSDLITAYKDGNKLMLENADLKADMSELRKKISDYNELESQNDFYKKYLGIKEEHPDFNFSSATLISYDSDDPFRGFVVNKGSTTGISLYDPVITDEGVVGYITEVGLTTSKVTTILSSDLTVGAIDSRTNDSGIVSGKLSLAKSSLCRLSNLSRSCSIAIGDYIVTSGEGIFPKGLMIGSVDSIGSDQYNTSIYADIKPFVDVSDIRGVMIITSFDGQGGIKPGTEE